MTRPGAIPVLICIVLLLPAASGQADGESSAAANLRAQEEFFDIRKVHDVHLVVAEEAWDALYPKDGGRRFGWAMGDRFDYVKADLTIGKEKVGEVGLRFKGNSTFSSSNGTLKRPLKIDFDRYEKGKDFLGLKKLNLHNNATDGSHVRDAIGYEVYRAEGVAAPRTCFARVYLKITGRFNKRQYLGLYVVVEQVDRGFMKRHFGSKKGLLMKPERRVLPYHGDEWNDEYEENYIPKTEVEAEHARKVMGLARLVSEEKDDTFEAEIENFLDVSQFLRYAAITTVLCNLDSPFLIPHNYYLVVPDGTKKVVWMPWDMNLSMGGFAMMGDRSDLSVMDPSSRMPLMRKVMAIPRFEDEYRKYVKTLIRGSCSAKKLTARVKRVTSAISRAARQERRRSKLVTDAPLDPGTRRRNRGAMRGGSRVFGGGVSSLTAFFKKREKAVKSQLAGRSEGRTLEGFGFGDRFGGGRGGNRTRAEVVR